MKILKIILLLITVLLSSAIIAVFWLSNRIDYVFVENYSLIEPEMIKEIIVDKNNFTRDEYIEAKKRCIQVLHKNHALIESDRFSLIINEFDAGSLTAIDDELFSRLTISINEDLLNKTIHLPTKDVNLYFSDGGAAWVHHCSGWFATEAMGTLIVNRISEKRISAEFDIDGTKIHADDTKDKKRFQFNGKFTFKRTSFEDVNNWIGKWDFLIKSNKLHNKTNSSDAKTRAAD